MPTTFQVGFGLTFNRGDLRVAARAAEKAGYDYLACGEHVYFHGPVPNAFVTLSHVAAVTERIRLLSAVTLAPLYPPALLAKLATMTNVVSQGRFELGIGVGGEFSDEFVACDVPVSERGRRTDYALLVLEELTSGRPTSISTSQGSVIATMQPVYEFGARLPIWIAGRAEAAMRRAGQFGDVWMPYMMSPEQVLSSVQRVKDHAEQAGREVDAPWTSVNLFVNVHRDPDAARRSALEAVSAIYQQDFSERGGRHLITGTSAECVARIAEYAASGASGAVLTPACAADELDGVSIRIANEVLPALKQIKLKGGGR